MHSYFRISTICIIALTAVMAGCAMPVRPLYLSKSFGQEEIEEIAVLPVIDLRFGEAKEMDLDGLVHGTVKGALENKNYAVSVETDRSTIAIVTESVFMREDVNVLKKVAPADSRWIVLIALHASSAREIGGSTGSAEMTAILFDRTRAEVVWRDKANSKQKRSGLFGTFSKVSMEETAIKAAAKIVMKSFPEKPKLN